MSRVRKDGGKTLSKQVEIVDDLLEFEKFRSEILPILRKDMTTLSAEEIYKKYAPMAAARAVSIALQSTNEATVLAATKDVIDRAEGKPKERRENTHRLAQLPERELDSLLLSKLEELDSVEAGSAGDVVEQ